MVKRKKIALRFSYNEGWIAGAYYIMNLVHALKTFSARNVNLALGRSGPVWARAFHDRALRCDDDLATVAQYIFANPQRAGLTQRYPYRHTTL